MGTPSAAKELNTLVHNAPVSGPESATMHILPAVAVHIFVHTLWVRETAPE
ncbi:hypothetical protein [Nostocoides sp.]|uniref:hypothetical protein n=1 Tax=Nostocoides sp. TaxID=1917966 RepID=UPI002C7DDA5B|nr:hypothetical protein [Tetrasphaera sp.]